MALMATCKHLSEVPCEECRTDWISPRVRTVITSKTKGTLVVKVTTSPPKPTKTKTH